MHAHTCKQYIFQSYDASTFNAKSFDENPFICQCEKEDKNTSFKFHNFIGCFQMISKGGGVNFHFVY